jgi:hypothetical protein
MIRRQMSLTWTVVTCPCQTCAGCGVSYVQHRTTQAWPRSGSSRHDGAAGDASSDVLRDHGEVVPSGGIRLRLVRILNCPLSALSHAHLSAGTTRSLPRSLSGKSVCVKCLREQHFTMAMLPYHPFVVLSLASAAAAGVFHPRGSANGTGKIDPSASLAASYFRVLTKPSSPIFQ